MISRHRAHSLPGEGSTPSLPHALETEIFFQVDERTERPTERSYNEVIHAMRVRPAAFHSNVKGSINSLGIGTLLLHHDLTPEGIAIYRRASDGHIVAARLSRHAGEGPIVLTDCGIPASQVEPLPLSLAQLPIESRERRYDGACQQIGTRTIRRVNDELYVFTVEDRNGSTVAHSVRAGTKARTNAELHSTIALMRDGQ